MNKAELAQEIVNTVVERKQYHSYSLAAKFSNHLEYKSVLDELIFRGILKKENEIITTHIHKLDSKLFKTNYGAILSDSSFFKNIQNTNAPPIANESREAKTIWSKSNIFFNFFITVVGGIILYLIIKLIEFVFGYCQILI